jgi:hypothetical protein
MTAHPIEGGSRSLNAASELATIHFNLLLSLSTGEATAAALTGKVLPHPREVGLGVLRPGQFDLQLRLPGSGAGGKDLQDYRVAIVDFQVAATAPVAHLYR